MELDDLRDLLTVEETAELLHLSIRTIYRRIRAGAIPGVSIPGGRQVRIPRRVLLASLRSVVPDKAGDDAQDAEG